MSIESAKAFVEKMKTDEEFAAKVNRFKTPKEVQSFLSQAGYNFTKEEINQLSGELQSSDLDKVSGGALPTSVNSQITDSVS